MTSKSTKCPNCGVEVDVNELLYHQLEEQAQQAAQQQVSEQQAAINAYEIVKESFKKK